ncbi:late embryogenesis abundant protein At1g64065 [Quercus suber]|uniref:Late embryogenesis abundant protein n=1 Tax=Quercus suber TaxID=58331 RepID=A0AAW0KY28_QUESU|nr:late embryogenesis abundant protein At1g64065-like [Quercus suber]POE97336.1 late embryogenesis abundant protein [Quercus suber]
MAMAEREHVKPLAPAGYQTSSSGEEKILPKHLKFHHRKCIKCFGCFTALLLIIAVIMLVLAFTVFHIRDPMVMMNALTLTNLNLPNGNLRQDFNVTLIADVSVKNPNAATFRYDNSTTTIYYHGAVVGEARIPSGKAKARRTVRMNMTVDIIPSKVLAVQNMSSDLISRQLNVSSYTKITGRVKVLNIVNKHVVVAMNCTITYNLSSQAIPHQNCHPDVHV